MSKKLISILTTCAILGTSFFTNFSADARTLAKPVILDYCKTVSQNNCIESVAAIDDSGVEKLATYVKTTTLGFTLIGTGLGVRGLEIPSPQPQFKIPGLRNPNDLTSDGVVEFRAFFAADPWVSFGSQPFTFSPPSLEVGATPVDAKTGKAIANKKIPCTTSTVDYCGDAPAPLGANVRIKITLRLSRWSANIYQIDGTQIDVSGVQTKSKTTVSITARPAKGPYDFEQTVIINGGFTQQKAAAVTTWWAVYASPFMNSQCRSGFDAIGGIKTGPMLWSGTIPNPGENNFGSGHFYPVSGPDGKQMNSQLEFLMQKSEVNCIWPNETLESVASKLRQVLLPENGKPSVVRPIRTENLDTKIRITLDNSNLLADSKAGMGLAFEGDTTISKWTGR